MRLREKAVPLRVLSQSGSREFPSLTGFVRVFRVKRMNGQGKRVPGDKYMYNVESLSSCLQLRTLMNREDCIEKPIEYTSDLLQELMGKNQNEQPKASRASWYPLPVSHSCQGSTPLWSDKAAFLEM
ncbi:hypothetical protein STEG23_026757 [Scotinomys teguina]